MGHEHCIPEIICESDVGWIHSRVQFRNLKRMTPPMDLQVLQVIRIASRDVARRHSPVLVGQ